LSDREIYAFEAQQRTQGATMKWEIGADSGAARNIRDGVLGSRKIGLCHQSCTVLDGTVQKKRKKMKKITVRSSLESAAIYLGPC